MSRKAYTNIHGRKGGRGIRPLLLIPKVLSMSAYFGALIVIGVLWAHRSLADEAGDGWWQVQAISLIFRWVIVPSLVLTLLFGVLLFLQHPRVFWSTRWLKLKLLILVTALPVLHLTMRPALGRIKASYSMRDADLGDLETASQLFSIELTVAVLITTGVIFIGRHKPRLAKHPATGNAA